MARRAQKRAVSVFQCHCESALQASFSLTLRQELVRQRQPPRFPSVSKPTRLVEPQRRL